MNILESMVLKSIDEALKKPTFEVREYEKYKEIHFKAKKYQKIGYVEVGNTQDVSYYSGHSGFYAVFEGDYDNEPTISKTEKEAIKEAKKYLTNLFNDTDFAYSEPKKKKEKDSVKFDIEEVGSTRIIVKFKDKKLDQKYFGIRIDFSELYNEYSFQNDNGDDIESKDKKEIIKKAKEVLMSRMKQ